MRKLQEFMRKHSQPNRQQYSAGTSTAPIHVFMNEEWEKRRSTFSLKSEIENGLCAIAVGFLLYRLASQITRKMRIMIHVRI